MKKSLEVTIIVLFAICFLIGDSFSMSKSSVLEKLKITSAEIPPGYTMGKIPPFAQKVLKNNPWELDSHAMSKLVHRIYPDGNKQNIAKVYMTILANKKNDYGDDIVCYTFIFKDAKRAKAEMKKLRKFVKVNNDRSILIEKNLIAVYLIVDRPEDFHLIEKISKHIKEKLKEI